MQALTSRPRATAARPLPPRFSVRAEAAARLASIPAASGTIEAKFARSFNVRCRGFAWNFHADAGAIHPFGIHVGEEIVERGEEGMPVVFAWPAIAVGGLRLNLDGILSGDAPPRKFEKGLLIRNAATVMRVLKVLGRDSSVTRALFELDSFPPGDRAAGEATARFASETYREPVARLVGTLAGGGAVDLSAFESWFGGGEGLTPAWDDFCAGMILADRFFSAPSAPRVRIDDALLESLGRRTTEISAWQIRFAAEGRSSLMFEAFLARMATGPISASDVVRCASVGHSSGSDLLAGVAIYLLRGFRPVRFGALAS